MPPLLLEVTPMGLEPVDVTSTIGQFVKAPVSRRAREVAAATVHPWGFAGGVLIDTPDGLS